MQKKHSIRKFFEGRGYYLVLAGCILAVGVSALIFWRTLSHTGEESPAEPALSVPAVTAGDDASTAESETPETPALAGAEESVTAAALDDSPAAVCLICEPVEGPSIAGFSADALAYNETMADWRTHDGIDIAAPLGTKVCAVMDGVVTAVYDDDYLGCVVRLEHDEGWTTVYANLTAVPAVQAGDAVRAGQTIGAVGQSAMLEVAAQPHLHFETWRYGALTDPSLLLE